MKTLPIILLCFSLMACGNQFFGSSGSATYTTASNNVTSSGQGNANSTLSIDVVVTAEVATTDPTTGTPVVTAPLTWTVIISDTLKDVLPNNAYGIDVTFPDGSAHSSGNLFMRSWSFAPTLTGAYRIDARDATGRTASITKAREN
jgi:hypothetical protein